MLIEELRETADELELVLRKSGLTDYEVKIVPEENREAFRIEVRVWHSHMAIRMREFLEIPEKAGLTLTGIHILYSTHRNKMGILFNFRKKNSNKENRK